MTIRSRFLLVNATVLLAVFLLFLRLLEQRSSSLIHEHFIDNQRASVKQLVQNIDYVLDIHEQTLDVIYNNLALQEKLLYRYSDYESALMVYLEHFQPFFEALNARMHATQYFLRVYTDNPTFAIQDVKLIDDRIRNTDWFRDPRLFEGVRYWTNDVPERGPSHNAPMISLNQRLNVLDRNSELFVSVQVNVQMLQQLIAAANPGQRVLIVMADGRIIADSAQGEPSSPRGNLADGEFAGLLPNGDNGRLAFDRRFGDEMVFYRHLASRSSVLGMKVVVFAPLSELDGELGKMRRTTYAVLGGSFILVGLIVYAMTISLTRRLKRLTDVMKHVNLDNLGDYEQIGGKDEVGLLSHTFNKMRLRINTLIQDVYESEISRQKLDLRMKEAELSILQAQINPHYLFNILNTLKANLLENRDARNTEIVDLLSRSFRLMLRSGEPFITIEAEVQQIEIYLKLQSLRYSNRLHYTIEIDDDVRSCRIPRLTMQPLVENAIVHGLETNEEMTHIAVKACHTEAGILIDIRDSGSGMDEERLRIIRDNLDSRELPTTGEHIGLSNVQQRLRAIYGAECKLVIESRRGWGTRVSFVVPMNRKEEIHDLQSDARG